MLFLLLKIHVCVISSLFYSNSIFYCVNVPLDSIHVVSPFMGEADVGWRLH